MHIFKREGWYHRSSNSFHDTVEQFQVLVMLRNNDPAEDDVGEDDPVPATLVVHCPTERVLIEVSDILDEDYSVHLDIPDPNGVVYRIEEHK